MKGLRKVLTPFAPDQSGAESVLYAYGGIIVILDAGGCTGNICGFDEPRWNGERRSALFSAGLRDMDAIMGRDKLLIEKLAAITKRIPANFAAIIGTPVPAVIGTDFEALARMARKATGLPVISLETTGFRLADQGAADAFLALFQTFSRQALPVQNRVGILGADPLDLAQLDDADAFRRILAGDGKVSIYAIDGSLEDVKTASAAQKNIVVSPAGLPAARWLNRTYGTPFEILYPGGEHWLQQVKAAGRKALIVHQQVLADTLRKALLASGAQMATCASWFSMDPDLQDKGDVHLEEEDDFISLVHQGGYDLIVADQMLKSLVPNYDGLWVHVPQFAMSGQKPDVLWEQSS